MAPQRVRRFGPTEIAYHWAQALPYLLLLASGATLLVARMRGLDPELREQARSLHLLFALAQVSLPALVFMFGDRAALLSNVREALRWGPSDLRWLTVMHLKPFFPGLQPPPVGKFNPGQKVNVLLTLVGIPALAASGLVMWLLPGVLLAWYVHVGVLALMGPMLGVHLFMALINPSTRVALPAVFSGRVPREYAAHHHGAWLAEVEGTSPPPDPRPAPVPRAPHRGALPCSPSATACS